MRNLFSFLCLDKDRFYLWMRIIRRIPKKLEEIPENSKFFSTTTIFNLTTNFLLKRLPIITNQIKVSLGRQADNHQIWIIKFHINQIPIGWCRLTGCCCVACTINATRGWLWMLNKWQRCFQVPQSHRRKCLWNRILFFDDDDDGDNDQFLLFKHSFNPCFT